MTENIEKKSAPQNEVDAPTDRKRIALLNGVCGQADRLRICGQVVDIPITEEQKAEAWDPFHGLPNSLVPSIRPMQDFTMRTVRRARLQLELLDVHPTRFRQNRQEEYPIIYSSEVFTSNDDSFFAHSIDAEVPPGQYVVRVILRGIDSIRQSAADLAYIRNSDSLILKKDIPIGYGRVVVLPRSYTGFILTSDIDQTFLDTPLHSSQGLMETLFQTPEAKPAIPGLPEFYRQVQRMHDTRVPTMFISASPHFFRRTLSAVFDHYDIDITGLHLKYLMSTVDNILKKFGETIFNLNDFFFFFISHSVERTLKFLGSSFQSLFDQIAYKTITLLENRQMQPTEAREILMGDNTEGD
ncbi:MAG: hypothetical protein KDK34_22730, partial [Leptospiraceae bacterium]|nr:hypothetical protein [Leptospiraceae bacterium]